VPEPEGGGEGDEPDVPVVPADEVDVVPDVGVVEGGDVPPGEALDVPVEGVAPVVLVVLLGDVGVVLVVALVSVVGCDVFVDVVVVLRGGGESTGGSTGNALQSRAMTCIPGRVSVIEPSLPCFAAAPCRENGPMEEIASGEPDQWPLMVSPCTTISATGRP